MIATTPSLFATPQARTTDPESSREAAKSVKNETVTKTQQSILDCLKQNGPSTDEFIFKFVRFQGVMCSASGCRTRRNELVDAGKIQDSQEKGTTESGRVCVKWGLK